MATFLNGTHTVYRGTIDSNFQIQLYFVSTKSNASSHLGLHRLPNDAFRSERVNRNLRWRCIYLTKISAKIYKATKKLKLYVGSVKHSFIIS